MIERGAVVAQLKNLFVGRTDAFLDEREQCVKAELTDDVLLAHLHGHRRIGAYSLIPNGGEPDAKLLTLDFDGKLLAGGKQAALDFANRAADVLEDLGLPAYREVSRSGIGFHVAVFHGSSKVKLSRTQRLGWLVKKLAGLPEATEVFPKGKPGDAYGCTPYAPFHGFFAGNDEVNVFVGPNGAPLPGQDEVLLEIACVTADQVEAAIAEAENRLGAQAQEAEPQRDRDPVSIAEILNGVPLGKRDVELFRMACKLRWAGVPRPFTEKLILEAAALCTPPFDPKVALAKVESAWRYTGPDQSGGELPTIRITCDVTDVVNQAEAALLAAGDTGIFKRGGMLVRVACDGTEDVPWLIRPTGAPTVQQVRAPAVFEAMARTARWERATRTKSGETKISRTVPVSWAVSTMLARAEWGFPALEGFAEVPCLRPDGSLLIEAGYDPLTGILLDPLFAIEPIPDRPTRLQAMDAHEELCEPLVDFPFLSPADKSVAIAHILTIVGRSAIAGPCPAFKYGAPTPGAGKGLLATIACTIGTGRVPAMMTPPIERNETRKQITALAMEAPPVVVIDNVSGAFGNDELAAALTMTMWKDRVLCENRNVTLPLRMVWAITGNNVTLRGDLGRRVLPCDIDPGVEHPEDRTGFKYPMLQEHVETERPRLLRAALLVLRGYIAAGTPAHGHPRKGSFERWDDLVRGALLWIEAPDPAETTERVREEGDVDLVALRNTLALWAEHIGTGKPCSAAEVLETAERKSEFLEALTELSGGPGRGKDKLDATRLGYALKRFKNRIAGGLQVRRAGTSGKSDTRGKNRWEVTAQ